MKRMRKHCVALLAVLALLAFLISTASAAACTSYGNTIYSRGAWANYPGFYPTFVKLHDNGYLYVDGTFIATVDISDPLHPAMVSYGSSSEDGPFGLFGDHMFVDSGAGTFRSFDISNPLAAPVELNAIYHALPGASVDIQANATVACVASGQDGLVCIDVSDPSAMVPSDALDTISATAIFLSGNICYVASGYLGGGVYGVYIVDVSNPYSISVLGSYPMPSNDRPLGIAASGSHVYVTTELGKLVVLDVSTPSTPTLVTSVDVVDVASGASAYSIQIVGTTAYVVTYWFDSSIYVFDISDPSHPLLLGNGGVDDGYKTFAVAGSFIYHASPRAVEIIDLSTVTDVEPMDEIFTDPGVFVSGPMAVSGGYAYVAGDNFYVVDISDPSAMSIVTSISIPGSLGQDVEIIDNYAYVSCGSYGVVIVDISDPLSPSQVAVAGVGYAWGLAHAGNVLLCAAGGSGLVPVDVSNPASPVVGAALATGFATDVTVSGNYAYVSSTTGVPTVVDISDPMHPVLETTITSVPSGNEAAEAVGNLLLVSDDSNDVFPRGRLSIVDISDPTNPALLGQVLTARQAYGFAKFGDYIYAACSEVGLLVIDASDPANPQVIGGASAGPMGIQDVEVSDTTLFVSGWDGSALSSFAVHCVVTGAVGDLPAPDGAGLRSRVRPNPFRSSAIITYTLPRDDRVDLTIHDVSGRLVRQLIAGGSQMAGTHQVEWDGRDELGRRVGSGIYFCRIRTEQSTEGREIIRIK